MTVEEAEDEAVARHAPQLLPHTHRPRPPSVLKNLAVPGQATPTPGQEETPSQPREGTSLIDNVTYRWRGHSKSDRNLYRTQEEIAEWMQRCPSLKRFKQLLMTERIMDKVEVEDIDQRAKETIDRSAEAAVLMPEPSPENMEEEVYAP